MIIFLILVAVLLAVVALLLQFRVRRQARNYAAVEERLRDENGKHQEIAALLKLQRDLAVELGSKSTLQESLDCILDKLGTIPGVDCGGIYLAQGNGDLQLAAHRNLSEPFVSANNLVAGDSPRGKLVHEGRVCSLDYNTLNPDSLLERIRSLLVVPVLFQGKVVAVLNMGSRSVPAFQPHMQTAIEAAAEHIGGIVVRIRAQQTLSEQEHSFRSLAESSFDAIAIAGTDRRFVYVNPQFTVLTGYKLQEVIGTEIELVLHPEERGMINARFDDRVRGMPAPTQYDALFYRKDGVSVPIRFSARRIIWQGQPAVVGYIHERSEGQPSSAPG